MNLMVKSARHQDQYIFDTQLGKGVFSLTYRAIDHKSGQPVVIKTLSESLRQHPEFDRFKQEFLDFAQRLSQCHHPNLVRVLDWFEEDGYPYLVMDYSPGKTLAELIQADSLPETKAIDYIRQIGNALAVLHQEGLLHRDIKPENIIWCPDSDSVVLAEFGITCELTPGIMQTHASFLSAGYAPLEQYTWERDRTKATDLYALGATLYCLLTGEPPLPAPIREVLQRDGKECLFSPDVEKEQPQINPAVKQALECSLELIPQHRPQTVEAWLSELPSIEKIAVGELKSTPEEERGRGGEGEQGFQQSLSNEQPAFSSVSNLEYPSLKQDDNSSLVTPLVSTVSESHNLKPRTQTANLKTTKTKARSLLQALLMTGAIAASAGVGFGFALRINRPDEPGSTILHTQQTFPPRSDWPVSESQL
ncbi:MAG TPA: hypothetical protein DCL61_28770 [Cyanobacteria bacterium UBA12227]|nr:hypothetical protein [Cyanobacteria bacterium UBA12227]HAX85947.1 hypothetical protein [Cyanobacteria bacterium UBA11370]